MTDARETLVGINNVAIDRAATRLTARASFQPLLDASTVR
jgi:hypothetical protein